MMWSAPIVPDGAHRRNIRTDTVFSSIRPIRLNYRDEVGGQVEIKKLNDYRKQTKVRTRR